MSERVIFVHGSIVDAQRTWRHQFVLAERWAIDMPNRPGFGDIEAPLVRGDFEAEAPLIASYLGDGAHLVGHSYGGAIALLAAALRPHAVRSLTVSEPGVLPFAADDPAVAAMIAHGQELYARREELTPGEFLRLFRMGAHSSHETPEELPPWLERGARLAMAERPVWEADIPLDDLAVATFPKLVISGGHSDAFEAVCDRLARRIGARRAVVPGRGHTIPANGAAYNEVLEEFLAMSCS